ncbi:MAG TPA: Orn/Lys/Arg decarboxylase N-terminal domain-containing protein [Candidatus Angelobacter sp.]
MKSNRHTGVILYVADGIAASKSVLDAIEATGYDVVSTDSSNQAFALLFIMHSAAAVVLDLQATEHSSFDFARKLRAIQPDVPIVLRCCEHIGPLPLWVGGYLNIGDPLEKLTSILQMILDDQTISGSSRERVPRIYG